MALKWLQNGLCCKKCLSYFFSKLGCKKSRRGFMLLAFPLGNSMCRNWCSSAWLHSFKENEMQRDWNLASLWPQYICTYLIALPVQLVVLTKGQKVNRRSLIFARSFTESWKVFLSNPQDPNNLLHILFENYSKCRIWSFQFWHFPPIFVLFKLTCLVASYMFSKTRQMDYFWHF